MESIWMKNYVRLARFTLEKDVIAQFPNSFGLTIPANLLFYYKKSMAEFIKKNAESFFIDPMTYIFVYPTNMLKTKNFEFEVDSSGNYRLKKSFEKVVCAYDEELLNLFRSCTSLPLSYFDTSSNVERFVQNNIAYQKNLLRESLDQISLYESMLGLNGSGNPNLEPEFITAPYFYFRNTSDPWYKVNLRLSQLTKMRCPDDRVYSVICVNKQSLNNALADSILSDFNEMDGFLLFISDFNESDEAVPLLRQLRSFVSKLNESSKPILNLYGSFFSILLKFNGLEGVSSGLCILDHRDATAEFKGGRAALRYYVPSLRGKLSEQDFRTFLLQFNTSNECDCSFCQVVAEARNSLSAREFATHVDELFTDGRGQLMADVMEHFLHNRLRESEMVGNNSLSEIRAIIETNRADSEKYRALINTGNFTDRILDVFQR
jgi:hypothetical protein